MHSKPIQICTGSYQQFPSSPMKYDVVALCENGSIWHAEAGSSTWTEMFVPEGDELTWVKDERDMAFRELCRLRGEQLGPVRHPREDDG